MTSWVDWDVEDEYGDNPTGKPGVLEFRLSYLIEPGYEAVMYTYNGDGEPGAPPQVVFDAASCTSVLIGGARREPTAEEQEELCDWLQHYLDIHPAEKKKLENRALEYSYIEPDYGDREE